jgi:hypothetical protein
MAKAGERSVHEIGLKKAGHVLDGLKQIDVIT